MEFSSSSANDALSALLSGDTSHLLLLLKREPGLARETAATGETLLCAAVAVDNRAAIDALLSLGADPLAGSRSIRPITVAVEAEDPWLLERMLKHGLDPNAFSALGEPLIYGALRANSTRNAEALLRAGADIRRTDIDGGDLALTMAYSGDWEAVDWVSERGFNAFSTDRRGVTVGYLLSQEDTWPGDLSRGAKLAVERRLKAAGFPFPPPTPNAVQSLRDQGLWPPRRKDHG